MKKIAIILWAIVAIAAAGFLALYVFAKPDESHCPNDMVLPGGEKLGGPIDAVDHHGNPVTTEDVVKGLTLVYFGYTFCPDICPLDTARNAETTDILAKRGIEITPIFITVDPERDTPEVMADFVKYTHSKMIGLSGSNAQIRKMINDFKVIAQKEDSDDPEYYTMQHTGFSYLIDENGFIASYSRALTAEQLADGIACHAQKLGLE